MTQNLIDGHDCAFFDLDGVLYLGPDPIPGAAASVEQLIASGKKVLYVTNNAARPVQVVAAHLASIGYPATAETVISSAQAAAEMLASELPVSAKVLVCGTENLANEIAAVGLTPVASADEYPMAAIQGYDPNGSWALHEEMAIAIQNGATWYATNNDITRPTDRGIVPGAGAGILLVGSVFPDRQPKMAGKPFRPIMDAAVRRSQASNPIFVGDRLDTDIEGATRMGMESLFVFSGVHGKRELIAAPKHQRPTNIGLDVSALLRPKRFAVEYHDVEVDGWKCGKQRVEIAEDHAELITSPTSVDEELDALWALLQAAWIGVDVPESELDKLPNLQ